MTKTTSNAMWGGRFDALPDDIMQDINASIGVDRRLYKQDIAASQAHAAMLVKQKIISKDDGAAIVEGLDRVRQEIDDGEFVFRRELEDIHMNVESRLAELIGPAAGRLHTARSRNDQVATDFRLWTREACDTLIARLGIFQKKIEALSKDHAETLMPGFTHLQVAQPVTLAVHLEATWWMMSRDKSRFKDCRHRLNACPLGAAALAGTPYPIDRDMTARELGFERPMANTLDAVSARDFATEFLFACAQCGLHLSRLAEEIVLWTTPQFGFMRLSDSWSTGSSIMPQKKNPDAAELVRAKTGRMNGNLIQLMTVMKALPLAYNKDMQEDKQAVFESFDTLMICIAAMEGMLTTATWNREAMRDAAEDGYSNATALADWLVMNLDVPFRDAHHMTGKIVRLAEQVGCRLADLRLEELQQIDARITADIYTVLSAEKLVKKT